MDEQKEQLRANIDGKLKRQAQAVFSNYGLSLSAAIAIFLRQSVIVGGIPFVVQDPAMAEGASRTKANE